MLWLKAENSLYTYENLVFFISLIKYFLGKSLKQFLYYILLKMTFAISITTPLSTLGVAYVFCKLLEAEIGSCKTQVLTLFIIMIKELWQSLPYNSIWSVVYNKEYTLSLTKKKKETVRKTIQYKYSWNLIFQNWQMIINIFCTFKTKDITIPVLHKKLNIVYTIFSLCKYPF